MIPRLVPLLAALLVLPLLSPAAIKQEVRDPFADAERALRGNDRDGALRALDEALKLQPEHPAARFWRGRILAERGDFDKALADLDEAARLNANNADTFAYRGYVWQKRGDSDAEIGRAHV